MGAFLGREEGRGVGRLIEGKGWGDRKKKSPDFRSPYL